MIFCEFRKWDDIDSFRAGVEQEKVEIGFIFQKDWVTSIQSNVVGSMGTKFEQKSASCNLDQT